jgi:uncharacterized membrane protein YtjA (UPF0391 family)
MFRVAIGLLLVAIIAAVFGFGGIASTATGFAKIVFVVALVLAVVSFLVGGRGGGVIPLLIVGTTLGLAATARADVYIEPDAQTAARARHGLVLGGSLGVGSISCDGADCGDLNGAGALDLHVGGLIAPDMALLLDGWAMSHSDGDRATFTHAIVTAAFRYWIVPQLWVQGGVGLAEARWHYSRDIVDFESRSDQVPAIMGAVGLEVLSSRTFALDLELRGGTGFFEDDTRVRNVSLGVGVSWF